MEPNVVVQCREKDQAVVSNLLPSVVETFQKALPGHKVSATIDTTNYVPAKSAGGVVVHAMEGRIACSNTLETRLENLFSKVRPSADDM